MGRIKRVNGRLYDFGTSNLSFLQFAKDLKILNIENWYFCLEIFDFSIAGIDPHKKDPRTGKCSLTEEQIHRIHIECRRNPWYYLRECVRIPDPGNPDGVPYKANRGNIAQAWCFFHGIDSWLCLPRQQGKTQSALAAQAWGFSYGTTNTGFLFLNRSSQMAKENLQRFGEQIDLLPEYMRFSWIEDEDGHIVKEVNNATSRVHPVTKNKITILAAATSPENAAKMGRGMTTAVQHVDGLNR